MTLDYLHIPIAILRLPGLNLRQKLLLGLVISFNEKGLRMSNDELAEIVDVCSSRISKIVKSLERKGYVKIKNPQSRYRVIYLLQNDKVDDILLSPLRQSKSILLSPSEPSTLALAPNITKELNNNYSCQNSNEFRLSELLLNLILERKPDFKKPNLQSWSKHIDCMIRLDGRTPECIEAVIRWCQRDSFWQSNILSTAKLREQFDQLEMRMKPIVAQQPTTAPLFRGKDGLTPRERELAKLKLGVKV